ncbi:MAG: mechanosensitive ion channel family protein [Brevinematia bacterium]
MEYYLFGIFTVISGSIFYLVSIGLKKIFDIVLKHKDETLKKIIKSIINWSTLLAFSVFTNIILNNLLRLPENIQNIVSNSFISLYIIIASLILTKIVSSMILPYISQRINMISGDSKLSFSVSIFSSVIGIVFITIALGIILALWNISLLPLITTLGIGGIAIAIALQDSLSNFLAGIQILLVHNIRVGDYIRYNNEEEGFVVDIGWRSTLIKDLRNNIITIPNSKLINGVIKNFYLPDKEMTIVIPVEISVDNDLKLVENITIDVAKRVQKTSEGTIKDFEPIVRYDSISWYSVKLNVILKVSEYNYQFPVKHEFIKNLQNEFKDKNIKFISPMILENLVRQRDESKLEKP